MPETRIENQVSRIAIDKLVPHPNNPNRMSKGNFAKLVRNIERTGRYEPLVVRPCPARDCHSCASSSVRDTLRRNPEASGETEHDCFQIINGHHRRRALQELGYKTVDAVIWDIDDADADLLSATLNRLGGSDVLQKKLALLGRLNERANARDLAKLLPHTAPQIQRLTEMGNSACPMAMDNGGSQIASRKSPFANPVVFFLDDAQHEVVEKALSLARESQSAKTKAAQNAAALAQIALAFTEQHDAAREARLQNPESRI
jgi:ParB-like chromosome segregation protein Spo0J